jgi:hypothetical protein
MYFHISNVDSLEALSKILHAILDYSISSTLVLPNLAFFVNEPTDSQQDLSQLIMHDLPQINNPLFSSIFKPQFEVYRRGLFIDQFVYLALETNQWFYLLDFFYVFLDEFYDSLWDLLKLFVYGLFINLCHLFDNNRTLRIDFF